MADTTPVVYQLTSRCGHHCGVQTSTNVRTIGHCDCGDCHAGTSPPSTITRVRRP